MNSITKKVMAARTALVLDQPFFGVLALRLKLAVDPTCKTAWVDGRTLGYNPSFVDRLTHSELVALLAHEVKQVASGLRRSIGTTDDGGISQRAVLQHDQESLPRLMLLWE